MKVDFTTLTTVTNGRWQVRTCEAGEIVVYYSITCEDYRYQVAAEDLDELKQLRDCINKYIETVEADS